MYRIEDDHIQQLGEQMHAGSESAFCRTVPAKPGGHVFQYAPRMLKK